jgi:hypothetical protein
VASKAVAELLQIDDLRAFDIKRLQLLRAERDELAALILVFLDDLLLLNLLAGAGIMRPEGNPSCLASVTCLVATVIEGEPGCRFRNILRSSLIRHLVWFISPGSLPNLVQRIDFLRVVAGER